MGRSQSRAVPSRLRISTRGASALLGLFLVQFFVSVMFSERVNQVVILVLSGVYAVAAAVIIARHHRRAVRLVKDALVTPFDALPEDPQPEQQRAAR